MPILSALVLLAGASPVARATAPRVELPTGLHVAGRARPYDMSMATGGTAPYFLDVLDGSLPRGLDLDVTGNALTGTPATAGRFALRLWANDANGQGLDGELELVVAPPLARREQASLAGDALHARYVELVAGTEVEVRLTVAGADARRGVAARFVRHDDVEVGGIEGLSGGPGTRRGAVHIDETGRYFVLLAAERRFHGAIRLRVRPRACRMWEGEGTAGGAGSPLRMSLPVPEGTRGVLALRSRREDGRLPTVRRVILPDGTDLGIGRAVRRRDGQVVVRLPKVTSAGDVRLVVESSDALPTPLEWTARLRTPRRYQARLPRLAGGR